MENRVIDNASADQRNTVKPQGYLIKQLHPLQLTKTVGFKRFFEANVRTLKLDAKQ